MSFLSAPHDMQPSPGPSRWARLRLNVLTTLRHGAWYPVVSAGVEEVVLEVRGALTIFARDAVQIVHTRPQTWSAVTAQWGGPYLVCPECAERVRNVQGTGHLICLHCHGSFAVSVERDIAS